MSSRQAKAPAFKKPPKFNFLKGGAANILLPGHEERRFYPIKRAKKSNAGSHRGAK
jgi:hypothetical protein